MNENRIILHKFLLKWKVGRDYGVRDVGTLTQRFMRIERFIPFWAEELTSFSTPFEAGNGYAVRLDKVNIFIFTRHGTYNSSFYRFDLDSAVN